MLRTLVITEENINNFNPQRGHNYVFKGVPVREVERLKAIYHTWRRAHKPYPYILEYEVFDGEDLYDYPYFMTPEELQDLKDRRAETDREYAEAGVLPKSCAPNPKNQRKKKRGKRR